jgi:hypothetical protein
MENYTDWLSHTMHLMGHYSKNVTMMDLQRDKANSQILRPKTNPEAIYYTEDLNVSMYVNIYHSQQARDVYTLNISTYLVMHTY